MLSLLFIKVNKPMSVSSILKALQFQRMHAQRTARVHRGVRHNYEDLINVEYQNDQLEHCFPDHQQ